MVENITQALVEKLPTGTDLEIRDRQESRLILRVRASGEHSYLVRMGKGKARWWFTIGEAKHFKPAEAREKARNILRDAAKGIDPRAEKRRKQAATFTQFIDTHYGPWVDQHLKSAGTLLPRIRAQFGPVFGNSPLVDIDSFAVERWRVSRLKHVSKATTNRDLAALKACLSKAVEWNLLRDHPLRKVKLSKEDRSAAVRFLTADEEKALRAVLAKRDADRIQTRVNANAWRRARRYAELPDIGPYGDHLTPIVLLALNTGCRRGELLGLQWTDVDLVRAMLTVRGEGAKSTQTRHVPLNAEAVAVLKTWERQATADLVFPGDEGEKMTTLKTAWLKVAESAGLTDFRFHDLRHTFASKLVQRGVDLATIRELLGHSDFALTLRYSHLAAGNTAAAVAKLA